VTWRQAVALVVAITAITFAILMILA